MNVTRYDSYSDYYNKSRLQLELRSTTNVVILTIRLSRKKLFAKFNDLYFPFTVHGGRVKFTDSHRPELFSYFVFVFFFNFIVFLVI